MSFVNDSRSDLFDQAELAWLGSAVSNPQVGIGVKPPFESITSFPSETLTPLGGGHTEISNQALPLGPDT